MRTTVDLTDETYRELKVPAVRRGATLKQLVRDAVDKELRSARSAGPRRRLKFPLLDSQEPGSLHLSNADIEDLLT